MTAASLAAWRLSLGFSKSEAARQLGLSRNGYAALEAGRRPIPLYVALACAALAGGLSPLA